VYRSARVIAIDCEHGLAVPEGNVLVIPLNQPNKLLDLTKEQFHLLFSATTESASGEPPSEPPPVTAPTFTEPNIENDLLRYLEKAREPQRAAVIASRLGITTNVVEEHLKTFYERGLAVVERGVWRSVSRPAPPPVAPSGLRRRRSDIGVSPQLGRILAAMAFATKIAANPDLTTRQVRPYLMSRDQHQYSARLPAAIEKGFVQKGLPLPDSRGWHYQITSKGLEAVAQLGPWSYEQDAIPVPDWLEQLADS
jgi:DNA-binding MarR family transcriptional regulator